MAVQEQTPEQRQAAYAAAGLSPSQQTDVTLGKGNATPPAPETAFGGMTRVYNGTTPVYVNDPTINQQYSRLPQAATAPLSSNESAARSTLYDVKPFDEKSARDAAVKAQEARLAATQRVFDDRVSRELEMGKNDLARANTISALTGMAGSPVATTKQGEAERRTEERVANVNDLRALSIASIYNDIDSNVQREKELALSTNRENSARILDEMQKSASANILAHATAGVSWDTAWATSPDFREEVRRSGADPLALKKDYDVSYAAKSADVEGFNVKIENGKAIATWFDKKTGKPGFQTYDVGLPADVEDKNIQTYYDADSGTLIWFDKATKKTGYEQITGAGRPPAAPKAPAAPKIAPGVTKRSPTEVRSLAQAGLKDADAAAQDYFLNTPKEFQDLWQRNIADSLAVAPNQTFDVASIDKNYRAWYAQKIAPKPKAGTTPKGREL